MTAEIVNMRSHNMKIILYSLQCLVRNNCKKILDINIHFLFITSSRNYNGRIKGRNKDRNKGLFLLGTT